MFSVLILHWINVDNSHGSIPAHRAFAFLQSVEYLIWTTAVCPKSNLRDRYKRINIKERTIQPDNNAC